MFPFSLIVVILAPFLVKCRQQGEKEQRATQATTPISVDSTAALWYKNSVMYTLDVEVFQDSDGDGTGDFKGLTQRLGYIDSLGADVIWLAPFQPTPNKDDGYDVSDYYTIDLRLGSMADFQNMIKAADARGLRIIMDLVVNHTSNEHPWFREAQRDTAGPMHDWYVWAKGRPENYDVGMVFPGVQKTIWSLDSRSGLYYYHRFYDFQPDLNAQHPQVQAEIKKIIRHWLNLGIAGFRLDGVPFFIEVPQTKGEKFEHQYELLSQMRSFVQSIRKDAVILGEANVLPAENEHYFGRQGEGMNMMFNFFVNQHLFYALATGEVKPLKDALDATSEIYPNAQWGQFLRNHDEVDLGRLSKKDREKVYAAFGPDTSMQLYDRGIRRRLAPMMHNNRKQLELAYSVLFSLPSTPVLRYGDEIGMGDNLALKERNSVRTPMQWSESFNGGFSSSVKTVRPVVDTGIFGYPSTNVALQQKDTASLLAWTARMAHLRKQCPEIAYGSWRLLNSGSPQVLVMLYSWQGKSLLMLHNFGKEAVQVQLDREDVDFPHLQLVATSGAVVKTDQDIPVLSLPAYGYYWGRSATVLK